MRIFTSHGGRGNEGRVQVDSLNVGAAFNGGGVSGYIMDTANSQEMQFTLSGGLGEAEVGGINLNIIPKTGGNIFSGQLFGSGAGQWSQGSNLDDRLRSFGITDPAALRKAYDISGAIGGPIKRDRLWFFATVRDFISHQDLPGVYANANAGDPTKWNYVQNRAISARTATGRTIFNGRVTAQITPKNKVSFYFDHQINCDQSAYTTEASGTCRPAGSDWVAVGNFGPFQSPEAFTTYADTYQQVRQARWTSTATSKLLLEAGFSSYMSKWGWMKPPGALTNQIAVTELSPFIIYRGLDNYFNNYQSPNVWFGSASYVTGAHSAKVGYQGAYLIEEIQDFAGDDRLTYTFFGGNPISLTMRIAPWQINNRTQYAAFYAQDTWTMGRVTLQGALRYDRAWSYFPADHNGAPNTSRFNAQPISFPASNGVTGYNDVTPRVGVAYDLFGNGKTSVRVNVGKYLQSANNQENYTISNPALDGRNGRRGPTFQTFTSRAWTDGNGNKTPDCDLMNPALQNNLAAGGDLCGAWGNPNFGNPFALTRINPAVLSGSGVRPYDWQVGASIQHEFLPRASIEVGYYRRWFGNFFYTDSLAVGPQDFDKITITAPQNVSLPNGGGYPVTFYDINPAKFGQNTTQLYYTSGNDYGNETRYWHGVDVTVSARTQTGLVFQGGTSTGHGVVDNCAVLNKIPELLLVAGTWQRPESCNISEKWLTQFRGLLSYTIPKIDVLISGVLQFKPNATTGPTDTTVASNGSALQANYPVPNAVAQQILGRPLAGNAAQTTVNLLPPGQVYAERINEVDVRVAKILRFGGYRANVGFDLYNLFNANPGLAFNQNYGTDGSTYLRPTAILNPRFVRFNVTVDF